MKDVYSNGLLANPLSVELVRLAVFRMRKIDLYWMENKDWYYEDEDGNYAIKDDAPEETKKSFEHYLEQERQHEETMKKYAFMAHM